MSILKEKFGIFEGKEVFLFTIQNKNGILIKVTNYGGIITQIHTPDRNGTFANIALGFTNLESYTAPEYLKSGPYLGCIIGRFGNRIANGEFKLDGKIYKLAKNAGDNHLHGGMRGFDKVVWDAKEVETVGKTGVSLKYLSKDMEEGYPGNLNITVSYLITDDNELVIEYTGTIDKPCPVNLTQHTYFNLNGVKSDILGHEMIINANKYTAVDENLIPTGEIHEVTNLPIDFRKPFKIGERIKKITGGGYDHNYVLNKLDYELSHAATTYEPDSGRVLETYTTEPGVQFYTGNFLNLNTPGIDGKLYKKHMGFCLEAQHYPDSPNQPKFPTTVLHPGEKYSQVTVYKFSVK